MDLRLTLMRSGIDQSEIADHFKVSRQRVWYWVNKRIPTSWEILLRQYFSGRGVTIYEKKL